MKTIKGIIAVVLLLAVPRTLDAKTQMLLSTSTVSQGSILCTGTDSGSNGIFSVANQVSSAYSIFFSAGAYVTVYSAAGSVATVAIETSETTAGPWFPVTGSSPITNPSALNAYGVGGETWWVPPDTYVRIHVTAYTSGNIKACISARNATSGTQIW